MLEKIASPRDLAALSLKDKELLAQEIRDVILDTVSENGGHLASNLGSVEMTIAMHSVFHAPQDKIVFDVGHQCYAHKLLTGRFGTFSTLRKKDGISGFTRNKESEYDTVCSGHASDSLSLALGFARARDLRNGKENVVAVLGDGALTGGMCYEALNDAGQNKDRLIILLNDNEMSISRNVGAMSRYLTHLRQSRLYRGFKQLVRETINRMPRGGKRTERLFSKIKDALKVLFVRDTFFDSLGVDYLGPVDGHDIKEMQRVFENAKGYDRPVVIHCVTQKGKGYPPAQREPNRFHGVAPFDKATGVSRKPAEKTCGKTACEFLIEKAKSDERIVCISAAMLSGTGMEDYAAAFPKRCFDVGIAEEHAMAMAAGMALGGKRPFVAMYATFLQRAADQININVCLNGAPVTVLVDRYGLNGADGETHQGVFANALLSPLPGLTIAVPSDRRALERMLEMSPELNGPLAICYGKTLPEGNDEGKILPGTWKTVREEKDVCLITYGRLLHRVEAMSGFTLVDARFIKPVDRELLSRLRTTHRVFFVAEEMVKAGGIGEAVTDFFAADKEVCVYTRCIPDRYIPCGTTDEQLTMCGLDNDSLKQWMKAGLNHET